MKLPSYKSTYLLSGARSSKEVVNYRKDFSVDASFQQSQKAIATEFVDAEFTEYFFDGVRIELRKINLKKELRIDVNHNFPFFKMHFEIEGSSSYYPRNKQSLPIIVPNGHHQLFFFPSVDGELTYPAKTKRNTLEITLSINFIEKVFKNNWGILEKLGEAIQKDKPFVFSEISHKITSEIQLVIYQIMNCKIGNDYKRAYLESKVIELLILQLQDFKEESKVPLLSLSIDDKIMDAKMLIDENISARLTIPFIAKNIGLNTQDLKKEFKIKFGSTIFKYITARRMELASEMLKLSDASICEIANSVGYKYSQHFTKAFKRYYNVSPSLYRRL